MGPGSSLCARTNRPESERAPCGCLTVFPLYSVDILTLKVAEPPQSFPKRVPFWPVSGAKNTDSIRRLCRASQRREVKSKKKYEPDPPHTHLVKDGWLESSRP